MKQSTTQFTQMIVHAAMKVSERHSLTFEIDSPEFCPQLDFYNENNQLLLSILIAEFRSCENEAQVLSKIEYHYQKSISLG